MFCPVRAADGVSGVGNGRAEDSAGCGPVRPNGARRGRSMPIRARERNARQRRMLWSTTGRWPGSSREGRGRSGKWPGGRRLRSVDLVDFHGSILASPHRRRRPGATANAVRRARISRARRPPRAPVLWYFPGAPQLRWFAGLGPSAAPTSADRQVEHERQGRPCAIGLTRSGVTSWRSFMSVNGRRTTTRRASCWR